jgi:hypothetical protein
MWICESCKKENCKNCKNKWKCDCKCNKGGAADIAQKCLASVFGVGMAVGGLVLTVATGGLAIPIGGALLGNYFVVDKIEHPFLVMNNLFM